MGDPTLFDTNLMTVQIDSYLIGNQIDQIDSYRIDSSQIDSYQIDSYQIDQIDSYQIDSYLIGI